MNYESSSAEIRPASRRNPKEFFKTRTRPTPEAHDGTEPAAPPEETIVEITLGKSGRIAIIDLIDAPRCSEFKWGISGRQKRPMMTSWKRTELSVFILGTRPGLMIDHWNRDTSDCRRKNMRWATKAQNAQNRWKPNRSIKSSSEFKGVTWDKRNGKWMALLICQRKMHNLGRFTSQVEAALAYNAAAKKHFGEFAVLNIIPNETA